MKASQKAHLPSLTVKVKHPSIKHLNYNHWHYVDIFLQWTAVPSVYFILPSLGEVFHFYMRRCRGPLDQMKAIVGLALWCLCNAYLLFWWKCCDHLNMFSSQGSATAKIVLNREKHYCAVEIDFLMSQFSEMSCLWNIMSFVPVSICCKMKKKDKFSLKIHQRSEFKTQQWGEIRCSFSVEHLYTTPLWWFWAGG